MDQKAPTQLDPKLQEAYDRVMGVQVPSATNPAPAVATPTPLTPSLPDPVAPTPTHMTTQPTVIPVDNAAVTKSHSFVAKKGLKVSPVVLVVGGIAFLLLYTVIWVKVFNLSVPFINQ